MDLRTFSGARKLSAICNREIPRPALCGPAPVEEPLVWVGRLVTNEGAADGPANVSRWQRRTRQ